MTLSFRFVVDEEKSLVFLDGSAQRTAKLVQIKLFLERSEIALGIEIGVAEVLVQRSVQLVGARLRGHQHGRTRARSIFRRVVVGQNFEFLNGVNRRKNR